MLFGRDCDVFGVITMLLVVLSCIYSVGGGYVHMCGVITVCVARTVLCAVFHIISAQ